MGEKTTLTKASTKSESLRTTVPSGIVNHFELKEQDQLDWNIEVQEGKLIIIVKPLHQKRITEYERKKKG
jgi:bifunctional DNA-binding transcriptional regulator/antitoxin component of YhaV-PrlF toxin-antitoxin module